MKHSAILRMFHFVLLLIGVSCSHAIKEVDKANKEQQVNAVAISNKPNILLIISDDLNTAIGPYSDVKNHTPNLDVLASQGVTFTNAYSQYPVCGPSRASFMSGLYPETNGIITNNDTFGSYRAANPALKNHPSMAGYFRTQGYFTARVSKVFHMGVPGGIERGDSGADDPDSWDYFYNVMGPETLGSGQLELLSPGNLHYGSNFSRMKIPNGLETTQTDYMATSQAIAILENRAATVAPKATNFQKQKKDAPFFLAVGLVRPHVPLIAPARLFQNFPDTAMQVPQVTGNTNVPTEALSRTNPKIWKMNTVEKQKTIAGYMASVQFMDEQVGRLMASLDRLDLRKNTIVLFMSDHGYNLGEHDAWSKVSLWEGSIKVPLIVAIPGNEKRAGTKVTTITELIDLYPTVANLCGLEKKIPANLQGKNLVPFLYNKDTQHHNYVAYTLSNNGAAASIRTAQWRYSRWGKKATGTNETLYNHINDPEELENLASQPLHKQTLDAMRIQFEKTRQKATQN